MEAVMPAGRPTKYKPEFCDAVIKAGEEGDTLVGMAEACDVSRETINEWMKIHPQFSDAVKLGLQKSQFWWEKKGRLATFGEVPGFNATSYIFQMKNRFKEDWREKQDVDVTSNGATIAITSLDLKNLTDAELESMNRLMSKAQGQSTAQ
jgi:transposase